MRQTRKALFWIISILRKNKIPFQISGGFAARIYGSGRELADIDIDIPEERFEELLSAVKKFIIFGPAKYKDKNWDLYLMTLKYYGQEIDLCGYRRAKIFDRKRNIWIPYPSALSRTSYKIIFGLRVLIIPKKNLIAYKSKLLRRVDKIDLKSLKLF
jgi:hypothetical protein